MKYTNKITIKQGRKKFEQNKNFENRMCRLPKQKPKKANHLIYIPQQRVIIEKRVNYKT